LAYFVPNSSPDCKFELGVPHRSLANHLPNFDNDRIGFLRTFRRGQPSCGRSVNFVRHSARLLRIVYRRIDDCHVATATGLRCHVGRVADRHSRAVAVGLSEEVHIGETSPSRRLTRKGAPRSVGMSTLYIPPKRSSATVPPLFGACPPACRSLGKRPFWPCCSIGHQVDPAGMPSTS
jgi:hypothetical protein